MKKFIALLVLLPILAIADTNVLELVWTQPPGYQSTLYSATNIAGTWTALSSNPPPISVTATQSQVFFYVVVTPTNIGSPNLHGHGAPSISAPIGSTYFDVDSNGFYINNSGDAGGWVQMI